jgi:hypothetical protein
MFGCANRKVLSFHRAKALEMRRPLGNSKLFAKAKATVLGFVAHNSLPKF